MGVSLDADGLAVVALGCYLRGVVRAMRVRVVPSPGYRMRTMMPIRPHAGPSGFGVAVGAASEEFPCFALGVGHRAERVFGEDGEHHPVEG